MHQAPKLLLIALLLLWLQLLLHGQLQPVVAVAIPGLMLLRWRLANQTLPRYLLLTLATVLLLAWGTGQGFSQHHGLLPSVSNLLWLMLAIQQLEARHHGQQQRSVLLLLLGIGLAAVGAQGLAASVMQGLTALLTLAALLTLETGGRGLFINLRSTALLVAVALPLLAASFVLLPRLEPLWNLPTSQTGRSGLSAQLAPGELASLVQDNGLAARLSFSSQIPPSPEERYWRVLVHQVFDGRSWSTPKNMADNGLPMSEIQPLSQQGSQQHWIVEPNGLEQRPWDGQSTPQSAISPALQITQLGTLIGASPITERQLYVMVSSPGAPRWQDLPPTPLDLQLPAGVNPRLQALGASWARKTTNAEGRINLARQWFADQGFTYTLQPGTLGSVDPLDRFLFETRQGFCEHYAASFSALMRSTGIPARVVVGYQGGAWQQPPGSTGFLELRNSDAHAWSEVWLQDRGWVRVDPTAWIVPERVRSSLAESLNPTDRRRLTKPVPDWLQGAITSWRGLDYHWQLWVMGFDRQRQVELLGQNRWQGLIGLAALGLTLASVLIPLMWHKRSADKPREWVERVLCQLQKRGHQLLPGETLSQFSQRVGATEPHLAKQLELLALHYEAWRFAPPELIKDRIALQQILRSNVAEIMDCLGHGHRR